MNALPFCLLNYWYIAVMESTEQQCLALGSLPAPLGLLLLLHGGVAHQVLEVRVPQTAPKYCF